MTLEARVAALEAKVELLSASLNRTAQFTRDVVEVSETTWLLLTGTMIFMMQCGFSMLEAGSVRTKNIKNLLMKNIMDTCISTLIWWLVGFPFAFHRGSAFMGALDTWYTRFTDAPVPGEGGTLELPRFFQQLMYAIAAATIVSGAIAERTQLRGYSCTTALMMVLIYPAIAHWVWSSDGWLSVSNPGAVLGGALDFAGGGVVHITGGVVALAAAVIIGPRDGRFNEITGRPNPMPGQNSVLTVLGTFSLWFGWLAFNVGSAALYETGGAQAAPPTSAAIVAPIVAVSSAHTASRVAVATMLAPGGGGITTMLLSRATTGSWDVKCTCNGILAGLVSITAGCSMVEMWAAPLIGIIGGFLFMGASHLVLTKLHADDAVDAFAVHGACGVWSLLAASLFSCGRASCGLDPGPARHPGAFYGDPRPLGANVIAACVIIGWAGVWATLLFLVMNKYDVRGAPPPPCAPPGALHAAARPTPRHAPPPPRQ